MKCYANIGCAEFIDRLCKWLKSRKARRRSYDPLCIEALGALGLQVTGKYLLTSSPPNLDPGTCYRDVLGLQGR